jgi:hypothetical protein
MGKIIRFLESNCQDTYKNSHIMENIVPSEEKGMPSKHIPDSTWRKVESETVKAVVSTQRNFKTTEVLNLLILKGLEAMKEEDYTNYYKNK